MPYDLYGQYYASRRDAENAEMAQCAAIDADITRREMKELRNQMNRQQEPNQYEVEINELKLRIETLENRLQKIESLLVL